MTEARTGRARTRCAIYTRKSTEEGLEQDFNSLDAQREACGAYVLSQKHEGWTALPDRYDDGGWSGGSMERPGLARLLADVEAGRIDAVIVYKVDRLTRSLADFARIVAIFDAAGASFVSVTQAFNTTTSMGRLTLNVLLSFAQFEREVTAERIRDKIAASKAKGMWMGGMVPIGYRAEARSLVPVPEEVALVQRIFARYLALGSVNALRAELDAAGIRTPLRRHRRGGTSGGGAFSRGQLYAMLGNPLFIGRIRHKGRSYPGQHPAIVDLEIWQAVQQRLAARRRRGPADPSAATRAPSPLAGRLVDPDGRKMRPSHANKSGRRYRYYVSAPLIEDGVAQGAQGWRIPAEAVERAVAHAIAAKLRQPKFQAQMLGDGPDAGAVIGLLGELADLLEAPPSPAGRDVLDRMILRVALGETGFRAEAGFQRLGKVADDRFAALSRVGPASVSVAAPLRVLRRGPELRLVLGGPTGPAPTPDPMLVGTLVAARCRAADYLRPGADLTVSDIARRDGADASDVSRSLQLAFLAPNIVEQLLDGTQPATLTAERLKRIDLPLLWDDQRALIS